MDCTIPSHSVRPFCHAIACLSRIGKDLYIEFDPIEGLVLRTLNDAKSAYAVFSFEPSFFERCSAPLVSVGTKRSHPPPPPSSRPLDDEDEEGDNDNYDRNYSGRIPLRALAPVVRPRRHVVSLRLKTEVDQDQHFVKFEFQLHKTGLLTVVHRMGVANDAQRVVATASKDHASTMVASPFLLLKMLEPLHKKSHEVAFIVNDVHKVVTATAFQHMPSHASSSGTMVSSSMHPHMNSTIKTETCIAVDELDEFDFRDDRSLPSDELPDNVSPPPPNHVNEEVALVFGGKETKAMLQFCAQGMLNQELRVTLTFHWGGRPILLETKGPSFSAQLIMATLDHKLLGGLKPVNPEAVAERERRASQSRGQ